MNFPPLCTNLLDLICTRKYNCPICLETLNSNQGLVTTKCNHQFCIDCYTKHSLRGGDISCPMCRQEIIACDDSDKERLGMYNQFEQLASTLEEEMVDKMAPVGKSDMISYVTTTFSPVAEEVGSASKY